MKTTFTKIIFSLFFLTIMGYSFAQSPQAFNYQAVARDVSGNVLPAQALGIKISLHMASATGPVVYSETHSPTTNQFGLFTLAIGTGTVVDGQFDTIAWGKNQYWLQVEMDPAGGVTYTDMGTTQLLSVPYALFAERTKALPLGTSGQTLAHDGMGWAASDFLVNTGAKIGIGTTTPGFLCEMQSAQAYLHINSTGTYGGILLNRPDSNSFMRLLYRTNNSNRWYVGLLGTKDGYSISRTSTDDGTFHIAQTTGYVGIGTHNPASVFHIKQKISNQAIRMEHESNTNFWNIGIGTSTLNCRFEYNGAGKGQISSVDGTYSTISDKRLKKDITLVSDLLDKVKQLNVYEFYYKDQEAQGYKTRGFIAQEVEGIFPDLVKVSDEGYKLITYANFSVVAIKAIQEQQGQIEMLKAQIDELKQEINVLKESK